MELRHLKYFIAVAESLNFRRAAERLRVAQPALSRQIRDLENDIGVKLLERNTGGTVLTEAGAVLLEEARDIMERVEMAEEMTQNAAAGREGRLTIAGFGSLTAGLLSKSLLEFRKQYPKVDVTLNDIGLRDLLTELHSGSVHLGFSFDADKPAASEFVYTRVLESTAMIAMSPDHPMANRSSLQLKDLHDQQFLCVGEVGIHDLHRRLTKDILEARKIAHNPIKRVGGIDLLMALVASDYGIAIIFPPFSNEFPHITAKPIEDTGADLQLQLFAVWRVNAHAQLASNFVEILKGQKILPDPATP